MTPSPPPTPIDPGLTANGRACIRYHLGLDPGSNGGYYANLKDAAGLIKIYADVLPAEEVEEYRRVLGEGQ